LQVGFVQPVADEQSGVAFAAPQVLRPHAPQFSGVVTSVSQPKASSQSPNGG
jgi:hypothetical protein